MKSLYAHQRNASDILDNVDSLALFYEQGTGKTMCVLDWVYRNADNGKLMPESVLIIAPKSALTMWTRAIDKMSEFEGYTDNGIQNVRKAIVFTTFGKLYEKEKTTAQNGISTHYVIRPEFHKTWSLISVDESHCIGNHDSVQTNICMQISLLADKKVILTGTPISGGGGNAGDYKKLYGQLSFLDKDQFGMHGKRTQFCTWTQWKKKYVLEEDFFGNPAKYDTVALNNLMKEYGLVARLDECYDMPSSSDIDVPVPLLPDQKKAYNKLIKYDTELDDGSFIDINTGGSRVMKLYEITSGFVKRNTDDEKPCTFKTARIDALESIITNTDDKVVIFCHFTYSVDLCVNLCSLFGKTVVYDGRTKDKNVWTEFQDGDQKYIVCQYISGGVAIDLFSSHTTVFYEPTLSSLLLEQQKQRIRRNGQEKRCLYYYITLSGCCDVQFSNRVRSGMDVSNKVLEEIDKELRLV